MPINPPTSSLTAIQTKVRRLTRSPSTAQLTDDDLNNYINTFVVYDFPEHLRTFNLRTTYTWFANPYQDIYPTDTASFVGVTSNPLYNFQNLFITVHDPIFIAGYQSFYTQSRAQLFQTYPKVNSIQLITNGDGVTTSYTGVINANQSIIPANFNQKITLLQNEVLFSSVANDNSGLAMADIPVKNLTTGNNLSVGNLYDVNSAAYQNALLNPPTVVDPNNTINYVTGVFTVTFPSAPQSGTAINSQSVPSIVSLPQSLLYYDNKFVLRPVPDQPYRIQIEAYARPTALLAQNAQPALEEYWQYISYGAAKKIFEDRLDMDSVALIMPEFKQQERMCLRRTIEQNANDRVATIYTEQSNPGQGSGFGNWGGFGGGLF